MLQYMLCIDYSQKICIFKAKFETSAIWHAPQQADMLLCAKYCRHTSESFCLLEKIKSGE